MSWVWFFIVGIGLTCVFQAIGFWLYVGVVEQRFHSINEANNLRSLRLQLAERRIDELANRLAPDLLRSDRMDELERRFFSDRNNSEQQGDGDE